MLAALIPQAAMVLAGFLDNAYPTSGDPTYQASSSGPEVTLGGTNPDVESGNPFPDGNTIEFNTSAGNITFSSSGSTSATLDGITGTYTNLSSLDVSSNTLTVDPEDKPKIDVSGDADHLDFGEPELDDGTVDFSYGGSSGQTTVTLRGLPSDTKVRAVDAGTDDLMVGGSTDGNGEITLTLDNSDHDVLLKSSNGDPELSNPDPDGAQSTFPSSLSVEVGHVDYPGEEVQVDFTMDGNSVGSDNVTSDGNRASVSINPDRGTHDVTATATDSVGDTTSLSWSFSTPENITVKNVKAPHETLNGRTLNFTFFEKDGSEIKDGSTSNGIINMENFNLSEDIIVEVEDTNDEFQTTMTIIEDITQQSSIYMLNTTAAAGETNDTLFVLDDQTGGRFADNDPRAFVQKPINESSDSQPKWKTVYADQFGSDGVQMLLEHEQRYRVIVKNNQNDQRVVGKYVADQDQTITLEVGNLIVDPEQKPGDVDYAADYVNTDTSRFVRFEYNDTSDNTSSITVTIYERGNKSNTLMENQTFGGPLGTISVSRDVPAGENDTDWVAEAWYTRNDETTNVQVPVGPRRFVLQNMAGWLMALISMGSLILVAGLFSRLNGAIGGLVVAGLSGLYWYVGFLPGEVSFGVVALAMIVAGILFVNSRGSAAGGLG